MPNYAQPFGTLGAGAGAAAGGGLLAALGSILDSPRQALWNAVKKPIDAISNGDWGELLGALPGAAGMTLAGIMGGPLGIAAGSVLGGALQAGGKATGDERFKAPEVSDLTGTEDFLPNFLVGALTDPLTYAGGLGGATKGKQIGQTFGKGLEEAAIARGPMYGGGASKIEQALLGGHGMNTGSLPEISQYLRGNPEMWGEIAPGSEYLGHGVEGVALKRPDGGVTMIRGQGVAHDDALARANVPEMLPAARSRKFDVPMQGELADLQPDLKAPLRIEHTQQANIPGVGFPKDENIFETITRKGNMLNEMDAMKSNLANQGIDFWDNHLGNVGFDRSGQMVITDAGALGPMPGHNLPLAPDATGNPSWWQNALLKLLGSDRSVQRELSQAVAGARPAIPQAYYRRLDKPTAAMLEATPLGVK